MGGGVGLEIEPEVFLVVTGTQWPGFSLGSAVMDRKQCSNVTSRIIGEMVKRDGDNYCVVREREGDSYISTRV